MSKKIKVLVVNEFSQLATGFSTYAAGIMPYLHNHPDIELAEFASYINKYHPGIDQVPWKVYANEPDPNNPREVELYNKNRMNQFGQWKFEEVLLDFKADVVLSFRDPWFDEFINRSPYRKHFKYIHMPTCDGEPQKQEWLDNYKQCDILLTYSEWAKNVIERQSGKAIKVFGVASPAADHNLFKPRDKSKIRNDMGLDANAHIIGTVMRNQPRKFFPELFKAFAKYLEICKSKGRDDLAKNSYLYCHTSFPDVGWDIPTELKYHGMGNKVVFTYMCDHCGAVYPSFWSGEVANCRKCGNITARLPNTSSGVNRQILSDIMSCFDLYIQYSCCEGWCLPINDAKACGVPSMAVDYSAMTEQCYNGGGIPIKVGRMFQEPVQQTGQLRALPDNDYTAEEFYKFFNLSKEERDKLSKEARQCVEDHYTWDKIAQVWIDAIKSLSISDVKERWESPIKLIQPNVNIPNGLNNEQFIYWCYNYILQEPGQVNSPVAQKAIVSLNLGYEMTFNQENIPVRMPVDRNKVVQNMLGWVQHKNGLEQHRYNTVFRQENPQLTEIPYAVVM